MKRLVCIGCGLAEDLNNPTGDIHTVQLVDLTPMWETPSTPDKAVEEDLCGACRKKLRHQFFGEGDGELLEMPLMKAGM